MRVGVIGCAAALRRRPTRAAIDEQVAELALREGEFHARSAADRLDMAFRCQDDVHGLSGAPGFVTPLNSGPAVPHPHGGAGIQRAIDGVHMCRGGDCVREGADGQLYYVGLGGSRVEPGEVRAALSAHPDPHDSAARPKLRAGA